MEDEVRQQIINLHNAKGVKYAFIATKIGVHRSTLCHFIKNDRRVATKVVYNLQLFLNQNN